MKKKDILFLCQYFYPENNSSATLPFDTARYFAENGYSVDALCGYPKEYTEEKRVPINETVKGVHIQRIRYLQLDRKIKIGRLVNYFSFTFAAMLRIFKLAKYRCVITYSNPPVLPMVSVLANILFKTKFVFVAYDVYPEIAYASGNLRPGSLIDRCMKFLNCMMYKRVSKVVALTNEMREFLLLNRRMLSEDRIVTIPNWAHEEGEDETVQLSSRVNSYCDRFVVTYLGNMGICQEMNTLCSAIEKLRNDPIIKFVFAGHGCKFDVIKERFSDYENVECRGFLTGKDLMMVLNETSCAVVSLEKGLRGLCAPSKYYSYLFAGLPVLAIAEKGSYLLREVSVLKIGVPIEIGDTDELVYSIDRLSKDTEYISQSRIRVQEVYIARYRKKQALNNYLSSLKELL